MSKTIRTLVNLQDALDADRSWRVRELSILRNRLLRGKKNDDEDDELALLRPCVTMIYAHWEGFVKSACGFYLHYVALQRSMNKDLTSPFLALVARRSATENGHTGLNADRHMIDFYRSNTENRSFIPYKNGVDTKSNLRFEVLREIFDTLGLDWKKYELREKQIDSHLVGKRNAIAHGKYVDLKSSDVSDLFDLIIETMDEIKDQILDAAINKDYIQPSKSTTHASGSGLATCM